MRWEDERYVRVYTRDTTDWLGLSFDAQALFLLLLRKVDRAGLLPLGKHGKRGVAIAVGHPAQWARLEPALDELLADGCVKMAADGGLVIPNFLAAQEARASDKARQQKARELARDTASVTQCDAASQHVTECHTPSHAVTGGHAASHAVTGGHAASHDVTPSRAEPCLAVPSRATDLPPSAPASAAPEQAGLPGVASPTPPDKPARRPREKKPPADKPTDPRHGPLVKALTDEGWPFDGGKDAANVKGLLALADQQEATRGDLAGLEVLRRARIAWSQFPGYHSARTLAGLRSKWGEFEAPADSSTRPKDVTRGVVRAEDMHHTGPGDLTI